MRLASYNLRGRPSFGAVVGDGIVDLRSRLSRFGSLLEVFRAQALDQAKAVTDGVRPDVPLAEVELLPPLSAPEKILCIGINYADRNRDYDFADRPKYPSMFYRAPNSRGRPRPEPDPAEDFRTARLRRRDRHGDRPRVQACPEGERARGDRRADAVQRGHDPRLDPPRQIQRHPGQEFRCHRQHRAVDRNRYRSDEAAAPDGAQERRGHPGRHHRRA